MSRKLFAIAALALVLPAARTVAREPDPFTGEKWVGKYQSAAECFNCHTQPTGQDLRSSLDFVLLTEYAIWKTHDKHAQAYAVLKGPRGKAMAKLLGQDVTDVKTGCMNCHAMSNLFGKRADADIDGVSCSGCHGPSQDWLAPHNNPRDHSKWRLLSAADKAKLGFRDLRDPQVKSALCMSCHIGNADEGKVVTHAMFAAGHPPLPPIEIATFTRNEPQHWRDSRDVPFFKKAVEEKNDKVKQIYHLDVMPNQRAQLALVGGVVALAETMQLAADRGTLTAKDPARLWPELLVGPGAPKAGDTAELRRLAQERWPEIAMAHSDCFACHHDLKYPGFRQERGFGYHLPGGPLIRTVPGRPTIRDWPLTLLKPAIELSRKPEHLQALEGNLRALAATSDARPFGEPERIVKDAKALTDWSAGMAGELRNPGLYNKDSLRQLLVATCRLYAPNANGPAEQGGQHPLPDYEMARQLASLIDVLYEDLNEKDSEADKVLEQLTQELDLKPYIDRGKRLQVILKLVQKLTKVPNLQEGMKEYTAYLEDIGNPDLLAKLPRNTFLRELKAGISNEDFTAALLEPATINTLQEFSNQELQAELRSVNDYDPKVFLAELEKLARLIQSRK
jgi:hypothetical protein